MDRTQQTRLALAGVGIGGALALVGLIGWAFDDGPPAGSDAIAVMAGSTVPSIASVATTAAPATTAPTTTTDPVETVEEFVAAYDAALLAGDTDLLFGRIHPTAVDRYGEETCRGFVEGTITLLSDYRLAGPVQGPTPRVVQTADGTVTVDVLTAPVEFRFQGQDFAVAGDFALVDGEMHWFTDCT